MATKYYAVLTNVGAAKLANATALGAQVEITQMAVGDGNGALPTPNPAQTALVHELRHAPLNTLSIDPNNANQIIAEQVIPEDVGGWWIREIGLFDKDGDMIAVANCAETYKPQLQEGSGRVQIVRMILIVSNTAAVTLKIDPSVVLATRAYVDSQIIIAKSYADDLMDTHLANANPHDQYPLIANALKEMADAGLVDEVLKNLGLGDISATGVATGSMGGTGYAIFPMMIGGARKTFIMQWGLLTPLRSGGTVDINLPIAFPTAAMQAYATHDNTTQITRPTVYAISTTSRTTITATAICLNTDSVGAAATRSSDEVACYGRYFVIGY
ncbi:Phage tail fiber protein [Escherichia coli]|uniref:phage tail protein n=1 Tax=Escherichia coli TaxID=562 RepID=UPI000BD57111|nr:phage tail protein [Escherichia coli]CTP95298.1 Phage tail fiber protein [Escherichia coli]SMZ47455.1 Phage tail fiber protein [Escherichia coli]